ncbi:MAG TPA: ATP-binding protein [Terriglobales bacterium]|nr:ATP-binding protein [Terriglobales bacterium]
MTTVLFKLDITRENDVVLVRQKARAIAAALKFDSQDQTRIATAVSEIARNTYQYGGGGFAEFRVENDAGPMLVVMLRDRGQGIRNMREILDGKFVSLSGMGLGILGAKRLMDRFHIETSSREGTTVLLGKRIPPRSARLAAAELAKVARAVEGAAEDPYGELKQQNKELMAALQELRTRQEELAQLNRELDETNRGVVALYAELNDKADFLQRASELKSHFLSNMSHEFRTPLNSIMALSQILLDRLDGELTSEQEKQVRFIRSSANDLTELVNDLLDLAKVEAGKITIHPSQFEAADLFATLRGMLRPLLSQNSSVNLVFDEPVGLPELYSDQSRISQILRNFISNALKFTERGEVRVSVARGEGDTVVFSVSDTGIGIAEEDQDRIFEEWTQVEGKLQKVVKGTGLGLPLSRKFAQLLGGSVRVQSKLGLGSTFSAIIPITFGGELETVYVPEVRRELDAHKIPVLVVEDNKEALFIYEKYLKGSRFQIVPALNLKEAREALREFRPTAVVLDVLLQGEQSWELLQELKLQPATANLPIFVITVVDNREKAVALGADAFHPKPVDRNWLLARLESAAGRIASKHVLVIDDDPVSRYLVKTVIGRADFKVVEAKDGHEGLRMAREMRPDVIILDLVMPDLSGFEVLTRLKGNPHTARIPVIVHTSRTLEAGERELLSDATAILSKQAKLNEISFEHFAEAFNRAGLPILTDVPKGHHA